MTNSVVHVTVSGGTTVNVQPLTTGPQCTWVITGGTGAYAGLQGSGTCFANAENTFPWINHTENGQVSWASQHYKDAIDHTGQSKAPPEQATEEGPPLRRALLRVRESRG
jgi:hypothetical protein